MIDQGVMSCFTQQLEEVLLLVEVCERLDDDVICFISTWRCENLTSLDVKSSSGFILFC